MTTRPGSSRLALLGGVLALALHLPYVAYFVLENPPVDSPTASWLRAVPVVAVLGALAVIVATRRWEAPSSRIVATGAGLALSVVGALGIAFFHSLNDVGFVLGLETQVQQFALMCMTFFASLVTLAGSLGARTGWDPMSTVPRSLRSLPLAVPLGLGILAMFLPVDPVARFAAELLVGASLSLFAVIADVQIWRGFDSSRRRRLFLTAEGIGAGLVVFSLTAGGSLCPDIYYPPGTLPDFRVTLHLAEGGFAVAPVRTLGVQYMGCTYSAAPTALVLGGVLAVGPLVLLRYWPPEGTLFEGLFGRFSV